MKYIITKDQFSKLLKSPIFNKERSLNSHTNFYYDTSTFALYDYGITLRIREYENRNKVLQVKLPLEKKGHKRVKEEKEFPFEGDVPTCIDLSKFQLPPDFPIADKAFLIGEMVTKRRTSIHQGVHIVLDESMYCGCIDYELEIEYTQDKERLAYGIVDEIEKYVNLNRAVYPGKKSRLFKYLSKINL